MDAPNPAQPSEKAFPAKDVNRSASADPAVENRTEDLNPIPLDHPAEAPAKPQARQAIRVPDIHALPVDNKLIEQADQLISKVLRMMVDKRTSDLHLRAGTPLI